MEGNQRSDFKKEWAVAVMSDSKYCYPQTNVLINHFNVKDRETLEKIECDVTMARIALLTESPIKGDFNLKHLQDIHYAIFCDIYPFAGQIRNVAIAKSNLFCLPQFIRPMADEIFGKLHKDNCLQGLGKEIFIDKLAFYSGEINALHPFREGNGRTQRLFLQELSKAAGYRLLFADIDRQSLLRADIEAMSGRYEPLKKLYSSGVKTMEHGKNALGNKKSLLTQIEVNKAKMEDREKAGFQKNTKKRSRLDR